MGDRLLDLDLDDVSMAGTEIEGMSELADFSNGTHGKS